MIIIEMQQYYLHIVGIGFSVLFAEFSFTVENKHFTRNLLSVNRFCRISIKKGLIKVHIVIEIM